MKDELDTASLASFLDHTLPGPRSPLTAEPLPDSGGRTYLLQWGERAFHLALASAPDTNTGHDGVTRQHQMLSRLVPAYPQAPRPLAYCADASVLGTPFLVVEPVPGIPLRAGLPGGALAPALLARLADCFIDSLAALHAVDVVGLGLLELGAPEGYVERVVRSWAARWPQARCGALPAMDELAAWLATHQPPTRGQALIHNAFRYENVVLDPWDLTRIVGVDGWAAATVGDPLMDLGMTLAAWIEPGDPAPLGGALSRQPGSPDRRALVARYEAASGRPVGNPLFYFVYGVFRAGVSAAEARRDDSAAVLDACATLGMRALNKGQVERLFD